MPAELLFGDASIAVGVHDFERRRPLLLLLIVIHSVVRAGSTRGQPNESSACHVEKSDAFAI
jgi:hypothetical protein